MMGTEGRKSQTTVMPAGAQCRETGPMDQGSPAPRPPGTEKEYCLTVMTRPFPGSTQSQETINPTASKPQHQMWPIWGAPSLSLQPPKLSAAKADRAQFKPKLLVRLAKVSSCHIQQGQKSHSGGVELKEGLRLSLPEPAAIVGDRDGGGCCLVEGQLLPIGPEETGRAVVVTCSFVQPGGRVLAGEREALAGRGTQQLQEGQLYHTHRSPIGIHVGELFPSTECAIPATWLFFGPRGQFHCLKLLVWVEAGFSSCREVTENPECIPRAALIGINPVFPIRQMWMAAVQLFAHEARALSRAGRAPQLL